MATKVKPASRAAFPLLHKIAVGGPWLTPPWNMQERLQRIEAMGLRIDSFIKFICQIPNMNGTSTEAKERAVTAFYEQMIIVEAQLGHIQEQLRLE